MKQNPTWLTPSPRLYTCHLFHTGKTFHSWIPYSHLTPGSYHIHTAKPSSNICAFSTNLGRSLTLCYSLCNLKLLKDFLKKSTQHSYFNYAKCLGILLVSQLINPEPGGFGRAFLDKTWTWGRKGRKHVHQGRTGRSHRGRDSSPSGLSPNNDEAQ